MAIQASRRYQLDKISLCGDRRELWRDGERIHLPNKPYQVLLYLIEHRERMVSRAELLDLFWEGREVYDETLTKCVPRSEKSWTIPQNTRVS